MLKVSLLVTGGTGIVSGQSGSNAWDPNHYSIFICKFISYVLFVEQCLACGKLYRSAGYFQWHLLYTYSQVGRAHVIFHLCMYICMYVCIFLLLTPDFIAVSVISFFK